MKCKLSFLRSTFISPALVLIFLLIFSGCGGGSGSASTPPASGGGSPNCIGSGLAKNSYVIGWSALDDPNNLVVNYRIYYGLTTPVTIQNAIGSFSLSGNAANTSFTFMPGSYNMQACKTYYFAVASGTLTAGESSLSSTVSIQVE